MDNNSQKNKIKKAIFLIATYFTVILTVKANSDSKNEIYPYNNTSYEIISPYSTYSNGKIYIADKETIQRIIVDSDDIYIVDERNQSNPNMCVCNSYKIKDPKQINEILDIIMQYEKDNPSNWNRTKESLYNEWVMHNIGYEFGYKRIRTMNVDFDNDDEDEYDSQILTRILK